MAGVELDLRSDVASIFSCKTATMNPMAMAKFFYIIYEGVLLLLFINGCHNGGLLGPISTYFGIIETNAHSILHFYCFVWLKRESHLPTLHIKIQENKDFYMRLLAFLEYIIKSCTNNNASFDTLHHTCLDVYKANTVKDFTAQLKKISKAIAKKV